MMNSSSYLECTKTLEKMSDCSGREKRVELKKIHINSPDMLRVIPAQPKTKRKVKKLRQSEENGLSGELLRNKVKVNLQQKK